MRLIIDDDTELCQLVADYLKPMGFEVEMEHDGERGADRGPGVPEEALTRLFDPFYRPEAARGRTTGGSGLGLAIAKRCIEACGGTIRARNRDGGGLAVTVTLVAVPALNAGQTNV